MNAMDQGPTEDSGDPMHHCGVAAIYHLKSDAPGRLAPASGPEQISRLIPRMLLDLQNRGQLAAGMTAFNPGRSRLLDTYKQIGSVIEAFRLNHQAKYESIMQEHCGRAAIGHVRYATCGANDRSHAQPFEREHGCRWKWFSFAFNGQLANYSDLREKLLSHTDYHVVRDTDTEIIMHYLSHELSAHGNAKPDLVEVFRRLATQFDGAYNLVFLNAMGDMVILRDPNGFHPLCWAQEGPVFAAASESVALLNLGFRQVQSLEPGQMILIQDGVVSFHRIHKENKVSHCFFEWIYFANAASNLDGRSVYLTRTALGKELADQERALNSVPFDKDTVIVPVPDTAKAAADSMAHELGIPCLEGLMRNRYVGRTFIEGQNRAEKVQLKYTPVREVLEGKRVLLIEDTVVRSTTLKTLLQDLRIRGQAREIHVRVACPPIIAPCFYGIDMSTVRELFAPRFMKSTLISKDEEAAIAKDLGADSLHYLPVGAISKALGKPESNLCRACITCEYPTETGRRLFQLSMAHNNGTNSSSSRTYELTGASNNL